VNAEPRRFGQYLLLEQIAVGGMAEIYLAKTQGIGGFEKYLALKLVHPNFADDQSFIQMLINEAKIAVTLNHVNIAQVFDLGLHDGTYYISMEYVDGADLFKVMRRLSDRSIPVPIDVAVYIGQEIAASLSYAHRKLDSSGRPLNIIHRDISPQNIMLSAAGEVKLIDFGIARADNLKGRTKVGVIKGKYSYMSPEQAWGEPLDHRTDVFSAGVVLYEVLTGEMLYLCEDMHLVLEMVRRANIAPPSSRRKEIPEELDRIILKAVAKDPADRWKNAQEFQAALTAFLVARSPDFTPNRAAELLRRALDDDALQEEMDETLSDDDLLPLDRDERPRDEDSVLFSLNGLRSSFDVGAETEVGERTTVSAPPKMPIFAPLPALGSGLHDDDRPTAIGENPLAATMVAGGPGGAPADVIIPTPHSTETENTTVTNDSPWTESLDAVEETTRRATPSTDSGSLDWAPLKGGASDTSRYAWPPTPNSTAPLPEERSLPQQPLLNWPPKPSQEDAAWEAMPNPVQQTSQAPADPLQQLIADGRAYRRRRLWTILGLGACTIILGLGATLLFHFLRQEKPTTLEVLSDPKGSEVRIAGVAGMKLSPASFTGLDPTKSYSIEVRRKGYQTWKEKIRFESGNRSVQTVAVLSPLTATFEISSEPENADVYVNKVHRGKTPIVLKKLSLTKPIALVLKARGYKNFRETLRLKGRAFQRRRIVLKPRR
jgi:eukaryotic-like serine/threonine-protein kinase